MENKKILLVEDDPFLSEIYFTSLNYAGFHVTHVEDGKKCLEMLEEEKFDLLVLDLLLPKIDGFEVIKKIKEKNIKIPIFILSNLSGEEYIKKTKKLGVKEYLLKTKFTPKEIVEKIKNFCKNNNSK